MIQAVRLYLNLRMLLTLVAIAATLTLFLAE